MTRDDGLHGNTRCTEQSFPITFQFEESTVAFNLWGMLAFLRPVAYRVAQNFKNLTVYNVHTAR